MYERAGLHAREPGLTSIYFVSLCILLSRGRDTPARTCATGHAPTRSCKRVDLYCGFLSLLFALCFLGENTNSTAVARALSIARAAPRILRLIREGRVVFVVCMRWEYAPAHPGYGTF